MNEETIKPPVTYRTLTEATATPADASRLTAMAQRETKRFADRQKDKSPEAEELGSAAWIHVQTQEEFEKRVKSEGKEPFTAVFAENPNQEVIGYCFFEIEPGVTDPGEKVQHGFMGVESPYNRQGIGRQLLETGHQTLRDMGIPRYKTVAREVVLKMYEKLGIPYKILQAEGDGYQVEVTLPP